MSSVLSNVYELPKGTSLVKKTDTEIIRQLDIEDNSEDEFYKYVMSMPIEVDKIGGPSTIDYSGFGSVDDGCKRK